MKPAWHDVLQEATKELSRSERHHPGLVVAVASIAERDGVIVARDDGAIGDGGAMNVPPQVFENAVAALDGLSRINNPALVGTDIGETHAGQGSPSQMHESTPEQASERLRRHEDSLATLG